MLLQEFAQLTGFTPEPSYFNEVIHPAYASSKEDKQAWCKRWKKEGGIQKAYDVMMREFARMRESYENVYRLYNETRNKLQSATLDNNELRAELKERTAERDDLTEGRENLTRFMADLVDDEAAGKHLRAKVIELVGIKAYLTHRIRNHKDLWAQDEEAVLSLLSEDSL